MAAKLRQGNARSAEGMVEFIPRLVDRYRDKLKLFWIRGDAAFASPEMYDYCGNHGITQIVLLKRNTKFYKLSDPPMQGLVGRFHQSRIKVKTVSFSHQAARWKPPRRGLRKIEWRLDEVCPRVGFLVKNSPPPNEKVAQGCNGRRDGESPIKERANTFRWDKTSGHRFEANGARWKKGVIAFNIYRLSVILSLDRAGEALRGMVASAID